MVQLISQFEPAILTNQFLSGVQYGPAVTSLFGMFEPSSTGS